MASEASPTCFTDTFDAFLTFAEKVLKFDTSGELKLVSSSSSAVSSGLQGYRQIYDKTKTSEKHLAKINEIYQKCRPILAKDEPLDDFMKWFMDTSFVILPQPGSRNKIYLTIIFRNCVRIAQNISDQADSDPSKEHLLNEPAAMYPEYCMLFLLRLFTHCASSEEERKVLDSYISSLETQHSLNKDQTPNTGDLSTDIFSAAADFAQDLGFQLPKDRPDINSSQIKEMLKAITQNPEAKTAIKEVISGMQSNPTDIPGAISKLLNKMTQTAAEPPEAVKRSMTATA